MFQLDIFWLANEMSVWLGIFGVLLCLIRNLKALNSVVHVLEASRTECSKVFHEVLHFKGSVHSARDEERGYTSFIIRNW